MKVLIDTDVLLDVALARRPFLRDSEAVLRWAEAGGEAAIAWHTVANCAYLLKAGGRTFLEPLLRVVTIAPGTTAIAQNALALPVTDLDDALQAAAALAWGAQWIVTRNLADYRRSPVPACLPADFLKLLPG